MFQALQDALAPDRWWTPVHERLTLLINHLLFGEPAALERLRPHAGRVVECRADGEALPGLRLPVTRWRITPAGALEAELPGDQPADLRLTVRLLPLPQALPQMLAGRRPPVDIEGDAQLAADAAWLIDTLRWDVEADVERLVGPLLGPRLSDAGRALAAGLHAFAARLQAVWPGAAGR